MLRIQFSASYGDERRQVSLNRVTPGDMGEWHILVDNYHEGRVWPTTHFGWQWDMPTRSELTMADITEIIALIEKSSPLERM